jgi:lycopene beta-cyclase
MILIGEWRDEWHVLSDRLKLPELKDCTTTEWESTECFFGGSYDIPDEQRTLLDRPYVRVDRVKMQELLRQRYLDAGGLTLPSKLLSSRMSQNIFDKDLVHTANASLLVLENGQSVRCRVLIDASGLESRLVAKEEPMLARGVDKELSTGFQIAYGFIGHVNSLGPYNSLAMTLFDYRTDYYTATSPNYADAIDRPTVSPQVLTCWSFVSLCSTCSLCMPCHYASSKMARISSSSRRPL